MKFTSTIIIVIDIKQSRAFYEELMELTPLYEFENGVSYEEGITLQEKETYRKLLGTKKRILSKPNNVALYFEIEDLTNIRQKLRKYKLEICHSTKKQPWGQKILRFYDPNGHLIEAAEPMSIVIAEMKENGLTIDEIAKKTSLKPEVINLALKQKKNK